MPYTALLYDIEANGFKPTEIFCVSITDLLTLEKQFYPPDDIPEACLRLQDADIIVGHYIRGYDCPVIERLTQGLIQFREEQKIDTLDMSKALTNNRKHSLEMWGEIFGIPKLTQPLFERYTPEMEPYCNRDVEINVLVFYYLLERYMEEPRWFRNHEALQGFINAMSETR